MLHASAILLATGIGALITGYFQILGAPFHTGRMMWFVFLVLSTGFFIADLILKFRSERT